MASPAPPIAEIQTPSSLPALCDEILEEIFLRLPTPAAVARASTACASFRRIITDRSFLRRFRKLHPPPLLGLVSREGGFCPAQAPHPSAPLARAVAAAADFTYSFVPKPSQGWLSPWYPRDVRDGRVLLACRVLRGTFKSVLAVCDPLSRRYVLLPPIPEDDPTVQEGGRPVELEPVLAPVGEDEDEDETSFKVICMAHYKAKVVAFVFSSATQQWCVAASPSWSSLGTGCPDGLRDMSVSGCRGLSSFDYVRGCFYSASPWRDKLLVLDTRKMEFSTVNDRTGYHMQLRCLPGQANYNVAVGRRHRPGQTRSLPGIVVGREGALEMFTLVGDHTPNGLFYLYHTTQQNNGESSKEWQLEDVIPLPGEYDYFTVGAAEGFLFLGGTTEIQQDCSETDWVDTWEVDYFSLEIQTSELKKICRRTKTHFNYERVHSYFGFPRSLSKPSI